MFLQQHKASSQVGSSLQGHNHFSLQTPCSLAEILSLFYLGKNRVGLWKGLEKKGNTVGGELTEVLASLLEIVAMFPAGSIRCVYRC